MALRRPTRLLVSAARLLFMPRRDLVVRGPDEPLPVVRIPRALLRQQEQRQSGRRNPRRLMLVRPGPLLVSARRPELNQPARLTLGRWERAPLASRGWKSRRARGDHFSIERAQHEAPALRNHLSQGSFENLGLEPRVLRALQEAAPKVIQPTLVQQSTIPQLLRGRHAICAAETGSGKTLSYLLPLFQRLMARPNLNSSHIYASRGLVLVPSRELAEQVQAVAEPLGSSLGLQVRELGGGYGMSKIKLQLSKQPPADVLVATPGALWKTLKSRLVSLERLSFLVLDEADTLLDESFLELVEYILAVAPTYLPTPGHYHVLYRGCGETQVGWHGETYCLVGGYRAYGDAPVATPAKVEPEKPAPSRAPKRRQSLPESDKDSGCPSPKIQRLQHGDRKLTPQKLAG